MIRDLIKNLKIVRYVIKFCPLYAACTLINIFFTTLATLARVYLVKEVVNAVEIAISEGLSFDESFNGILRMLLIYIGVLTVCRMYTVFYNNYLDQKYSTIYVFKIQQLMFRKAHDVDFADFDNPDFYDMYSRALRDGTWRGFRVYRDFANFLSSIISVFALGTFIVLSDPILIVVVLVSVLSRILLANRVNINNHKLDEEIEIERRMYGYVNRTFYQQRFAAEIKTTPISNLLIEKCNDAQVIIDKKYIATHKKNTVLQSISKIISNAFESGGMYFYLGYSLINGLITIASFSSMITAATQFSNNFYETASFFSKVKNNSMYIDYFLDYMNYKPKLENEGMLDLDEEFKELKFIDVSFKYPNTDKYVLSNINLHIKRGDKVAFVGENGAGKTTLIKLLLKFYDPDIGDIYYNNQTIRDTKEDVIRRKYSIIFQDYRIYGVSIAENILMRKYRGEVDDIIVNDALEKVDLKETIDALPNGIHTIFSREFGEDGVQLSGGEMQRLAIARVFASNADIYILDEPTSSLDPLSERNINKLLIEKCQDKTIILIAHRLSTVVDSDRIVLIENGKIKEEGTHQELLALNGKYHEMFMTQATLYIREEGRRRHRDSLPEAQTVDE